MSVPEPEKGHEEGQDEEAPEAVLLIRLDEADALVHLRSMVSDRLLVYFSLPPLPFHPPSSVMGSRGSRPLRLVQLLHEFLGLMGVIMLTAGISFLLFTSFSPLPDRHKRQRNASETC